MTTLQFWEAGVWPLKIAMIGTWWQPPSLQNPGRTSAHTRTQKNQPCNTKLYVHESIVLTCFKMQKKQIYLTNVRPPGTQTPFRRLIALCQPLRMQPCDRPTNLTAWDWWKPHMTHRVMKVHTGGRTPCQSGTWETTSPVNCQGKGITINTSNVMYKFVVQNATSCIFISGGDVPTIGELHTHLIWLIKPRFILNLPTRCINITLFL